MSRNKLHNGARSVTKLAIRAGILKRLPCEVCGSTDADAHHEDYAKPLDVRWLCPAHHRQHHKQHGYAAAGPGRPPRASVRSARRFEIRLTDEERARWRGAASRKGMTLAEFIRLAVESAANT